MRAETSIFVGFCAYENVIVENGLHGLFFHLAIGVLAKTEYVDVLPSMTCISPYGQFTRIAFIGIVPSSHR